MRDVNRRELLAITAGALAAPLIRQTSFAADPPANKEGWRSFRNGKQLLGLAKAELPDPLKERWSLKAPVGISATAAIGDGRAYIADLDGRLRCVDIATGGVQWTYMSLKDVPENRFRPSFKSSPALTDESVLLGDGSGIFHAVNRTTGKRRWTFETGAEIISSPTIDGENVLFGSYDNTLYCLNHKSGARRWQLTTNGYVHCTPAVSEGTTFIAGCDEHLRGVDVASGKQVLDMPIGTYLIASPATRDGLLYFGTYAAKVLAVDWRRKKIAWAYEAGRNFPFHSSAAVTDDLVVVGGGDQNVHAIDRKNGKRVWIFPTRANVESSPVICGGRVYVGSSDRNLYVLDLASGKELGKYNLGADVTASPAIGEGSLVIGGDGNNARAVCLG